MTKSLPLQSLAIHVAASAVLLLMAARSGAAAESAPAAAPKAGKPAKAWTLATDDTKLTIGVTSDSELCLYELSSPRSSGNWIAEPSVFRLMGRAEIGGVLRELHWTYKDAQVEAGGGRKLTVRFACAEPALELRSVWHARKGPGPVRHAMFVANRSGKSVTLTFQPSVDLALVPPAGGQDALRAWYVKDEGAWWPDNAKEKPGVVREAVSPAYAKEVPAMSGNDWVPIVILDSGGARGVYAAIEWSHCRLKVTGRGAPAALRVEGGAPANFTTEVPDGCDFEMPPALIGAYAGDVDDAGNSLRKYLFHYSMPEELRTDPTYPKLEWNAFTATGKSHKSQTDPAAWEPVEVKYYPLIKEAGALGFEEMAVDIGWWNGGEPDAKRADWPGGMKAAGDATHRLGMRYVLYWTDKENMATPAGRATRARRIQRLFAEYGADAWRSDDTHGPVVGADNGSVKGFYDMLDALKKEIPRFQWENSSGGGLKDYGAMKRATKIQITDTICPAIATRRVFFDSSYALHPMQMQAMLGWHARNRPGESGGLVYDFRSAALGAFMWWFDNPNPTNGGVPWTKAERQAIAREVQTYKTRLRPLIREANLYHVLPRPDNRNWDAIEYYDPTAGKGVVYVFKPQSPSDSQAIELKGLDAKRAYKLTFEDGSNRAASMTGGGLMAGGFRMSLHGTFVSELVWILRE